jgi:glycosyltransferase involved in cell wall biosynthesis
MTKSQTLFINGRFLAQPLSGVQRYAEEITVALDSLAGEGRLSMSPVLLAPKGARTLDLRFVEQREIVSGKGHWWEQVAFASAVAGGVVLSLAMSGPVLHARQLVVIHDAAIYRHPEHFSRSYVLLHKLIEAGLAKRAHIATVSNFSRDELAHTLRLDPSTIVVAPNGVEHLQIKPDNSVVERLGLAGVEFFLVLGNLTRNKNLAAAVRAFTRLRQPAKLVAVGRIDRSVFGAELPPSSPDLLLPGRL